MNPLSYFQANQSAVISALLQHIHITLLTLVIALAIALPIGTLVARFRALDLPVLGLLALIYTIPSLALFAYLITYVGIGLTSALIALVGYAQFVLVRNIVVGLRSVDPVVLDAARGMGMNARQILFRVEYPLALPVILAGLRIATVATIAITTVAALDDSGGLGTLLFDGLNNGQNGEIVVGAVAVSLLAIAADIVLRLVDRAVPAQRAARST